MVKDSGTPITNSVEETNMAQRDTTAKPHVSRHLLSWFLPSLFLAGCFAVSIHFSRAGWNLPLTDHWRFRETQTAWTTRTFLEDGFRLDYETPVLGAPWSIPFEFPTYQACVALLVKITGAPLVQTGRAVSLIFGYAAFALFGVFVARVSGSRAAGIFSTGLCLVSPVYLYGSRAFMIESTALFFTVGLLLATHEFLTRPRVAPLVLLFLAGCLAGPTKATTYGVGLIGVVGLVLLHVRQLTPLLASERRPWRLLGGFALALTGPFLLTLAWTRYTDVVKTRNELAAFISSSALHDWNFGTLRQRLDFASWEQLASWVDHSILGTPLSWMVGAVVLASAVIRREFAYVLVAMALSGAVVFTNLYLVHEYYHYATGIYLLGLFGLGLGALADGPTLWSRLGALAAATLLAVLMTRGYVHRNLAEQLKTDQPLLELAAGIKHVAPAGSAILVYGHEWESTLSFYAERRALMDRYNLPPADPKIQRALARLDRPLGAVVFTSFFRNDWRFMLTQLGGLGLGHQRVVAAAAGDVFPAHDAPGVQAAAWQRAGFAEVPGVFESALQVSETTFAGRPAMMIHAPGMMVIDRGPLDRHHLRATYGITENAYAGATPTDGVTFTIDFVDAERHPTPLFARRLDPSTVATDRGPQSIQVALPDREGVLIFRTEPGESKSCDWSVWQDVQLH